MHDGESFESPVDLPGRFQGMHRPLRWTSLTILTASLFLLATNAFSMREWIDEQTPGPMQARIATAAAAWEAQTGTFGLGAIRRDVHALWKKGQEWRFDLQRNPRPDTVVPGRADQR